MPEVKKIRNNKKMISNSSESNAYDHGCLPLELITDILLRLPVKSLGRCKLVCKSWNFLISTDNFAKSHLQFQISSTSNNPSALTSIFLVSKDEGRLFSHDLKLVNGYCLDVMINVGLMSPLKLGYPLHCSTIYPPLGSCNGLMCIVETMNADGEPICVFNPTTKEFKYVPFPSCECHQPTRQWASGLGFVPSFGDYKIVLLEQTVTFTSNGTVCNNTVDVFSLRDDQWKQLDSSSSNLNASLDRSYLDTVSPGVWCNEALYWVVPKFPAGPPGSFFILEFNLRKERFSRVADVEHNREDADRKNMYYDHRNLSIGVIAQKQVCVGQIHYMASGEQFLEVWMMEKYGQLNRLFMLQLAESDIKRKYLGILGFTPNGSVWLESNAQGRHDIFLLNLRRNPPTCVLISQRYVHHIMSYIPSLFSPSHVRSVTE